MTEYIRDCNLLKTYFTELKELFYPDLKQDKLPFSEDVGGKRMFITMAKPITQIKNILLKDAKKKDLVNPLTGKAVEIKAPLAEFLMLAKRGITTQYYNNTIFLSFFADYIYRNGLKQGKSVIFTEQSSLFKLLKALPTHEFDALFLPQRRMVDKVTEVEVRDAKTGQMKMEKQRFKVPEERSPILTHSDGKFTMNFSDSLSIFSKFTEKGRANDHTQSLKQKSIDLTDLPTPISSALEREREFFTKTITTARKAYSDAVKKLASYKESLNKATFSGTPDLINAKLRQMEADIESTKYNYVNILNANGFEHTLQ